MQNEVGGQSRRRRLGNVPVGVCKSDHVVGRECLEERGPELSARAGD
jgi:hypothetical protein